MFTHTKEVCASQLADGDRECVMTAPMNDTPQTAETALLWKRGGKMERGRERDGGRDGGRVREGEHLLNARLLCGAGSCCSIVSPFC